MMQLSGVLPLIQKSPHKCRHNVKIYVCYNSVSSWGNYDEIGFSNENWLVCIPFNRNQKILLDPVKLEKWAKCWHVNFSVHKCKKASSVEKKKWYSHIEFEIYQKNYQCASLDCSAKTFSHCAVVEMNHRRINEE